MITPSSSLPALPPVSRDNPDRERQQHAGRDQRVQRDSNRPAVEFIQRGTIDDSERNNESVRNLFDQRVNPANRSALLSYSITESSSIGQPQRVGRYLDLFL